jgi:hypothetical protein
MGTFNPNILLDLEKQQAESEGFTAGPAPQLNSPNLNTQIELGVSFPIPPPPGHCYPILSWLSRDA